jgi:hypothetical protein
MASTKHDLKSKLKLPTMQTPAQTTLIYVKHKQCAQQKETHKKTLGKRNSKNFEIPEAFITL